MKIIKAILSLVLSVICSLIAAYSLRYFINDWWGFVSYSWSGVGIVAFLFLSAFAFLED